MVYEDILRYFGQQNFAVASTAGAAVGLNILYNRVGAEPIYCILVNHCQNNFLKAEQLQRVHFQLSANVPERNILFVIATEHVERDKALTQLAGVQVWLADARERRLLIYENQADDFFGLKKGLVQALSETPKAKMQLGLRFKNLPFVSLALILINLVWFIILAAKGDPSSPSYMIAQGASYGPLIFEHYQFWRLFTNMFMHFGASHLIGNMLYVALAGNTLEKAIGRWRYLSLYLLSGFGASVVSAAYYYLTDQNIVSGGASGAVYGLIGAVIYLMIKNRGRMRPAQLWIRIGIIFLFLFYSNYINDGIDVVAHAAGLIFGFILSMALIGGKRK